jgi:TetR/AcrR family transcriptional regulator, cholesterol catabolism regulator
MEENADISSVAATQSDAGRSTSGENTRLRIQRAALELFWEKGYESTTTRDVAATLGVQQASLYYHIKNKEELLHGICYSAFMQMIQNAEAAVASGRDPLDRMRQVGKNHLRTILEYQKEFCVAIMECHALSPAYRGQIEDVWQRYKKLIFSVLDEAKADGTIRADVPNRYQYMALMSMLNWSTIWYRPGEELDISRFDRIFSSMYFHGTAISSPGRVWCQEVAVRAAQPLETSIVESLAVPVSETHATLLNAACTLFKRKGYFATSMREIADLAGMQKASAYYYIATKEDLLYQISIAVLNHISGRVKAALSGISSPGERVCVLITFHVVSLLQHQDWYATANDEVHALSPARREEVVSLRNQYEALVRTTLEEAQSAGFLRKDIPAKFLGLGLLGMINLIYPWYQPAVDVTPVELGSILSDIFFTGIACSPAAALPA